MTTLITDSGLEARLIAERQAAGADRFDEVWDGVYMMTPSPNEEHQDVVMGLGAALKCVIDSGTGGKVYPGVNVSARVEDWEHEYRIPDLAVYLANTTARNCGTHWAGGPEFAVEITSPGDRTREKIAFYGRIGSKELLIVDRDPWALELWRLDLAELKPVGMCGRDGGQSVSTVSLPLSFRLVEMSETHQAARRPQIEVRQTQTGQIWLV